MGPQKPEAENVCKFDDEVGAMHTPAVVDEEGVEEWAKHTALWYTGVEGDSGGAGVAWPNILRSLGVLWLTERV